MAAIGIATIDAPKAFKVTIMMIAIKEMIKTYSTSDWPSPRRNIFSRRAIIFPDNFSGTKSSSAGRIIDMFSLQAVDWNNQIQKPIGRRRCLFLIIGP